MGRTLIGNFKGPKGDKGDPGPQGPAGPQGPVGLVNADGAVEFEDYTSEGAELPAPEDALAAVTSGRSLKSIFSGIRAFCKNMLDSESGSRKMIGDAFSEEQTYVAGEYAIYDNVLYKFTAAKAAGTWNPDVAAPTTIAEVVRELNGNLTALSDKMVNSIVVRTVMWSGVVPAGGAGRPSVTVPTVKGYTPIAAIPQDLAAWFFYSRCSLSGNTWNATICSTYEDGQPHSLTAYACILYVKNS